MNDPKNAKEDYDQWWGNFHSLFAVEPGTKYRTNLVVKKIRSLGIKNIADIGCGAGELIKRIDQEFPGLSLTGFDVSPFVIEVNKKEIKNAKFFTLDLNENVMPKDTFAMVLCCEVIEHVKNWEQAVTVLSGLVQDGGYVIITTQAGKMFAHHKTLGHFKHYKKEEIEKELEKNGITVTESFYSGWPFMNLKNYLINMRYKSIEDSPFSSKRQSYFNKAVFRVFDFLYANSSQKTGPQIFILGQKKAQ